MKMKIEYNIKSKHKFKKANKALKKISTDFLKKHCEYLRREYEKMIEVMK